MRIYLYSWYVGFLEVITYRWAILLSLVSEVVLMVAFYFLWQAVFRSSPNQSVEGTTFEDFFFYLLVARAISRLMAGRPWGFFYEGVRSGNIVMDMLIPANYVLLNLFRHLGTNTAHFVLAIPGFLIAILALSPPYPSHLWILGFLASVLLAFTAAYFFEFVVSLTAFYTPSQQGIHEAKTLLVALLSGAFFPLDYLPKAVESVVRLLPFAHFVYSPTKIFLGSLSASNVVEILALQAAWVLVLAILAASGMRKGRRALNVQGG